ncbi:MAG: YaeQ family protein [Abditibacteriales bacterium]|nr:YaeQ family protein [Abditibacteriales bacterium]MDW8365585.1 YaeQ family protein [Abditibacteriales bacterium]
MKYTFTIHLMTSDAQHREKLVIAAGAGEVAWHVALKLIGYLLFIEDRPRIEEGIDWHYKPDLVAHDAEGRLTLWVDCGNIAVKKVDAVATKVGTAARFVILRRTRREAERLHVVMGKKVKHRQRVIVLSFDDDFVDALADSLDSTNELTCRRTADGLHLRLVNRHGGRYLTTRIYRW